VLCQYSRPTVHRCEILGGSREYKAVAVVLSCLYGRVLFIETRPFAAEIKGLLALFPGAVVVECPDEAAARFVFRLSPGPKIFVDCATSAVSGDAPRELFFARPTTRDLKPSTKHAL